MEINGNNYGNKYAIDKSHTSRKHDALQLSIQYLYLAAEYRNTRGRVR